MSKYTGDAWVTGIKKDDQKAITSFAAAKKEPKASKWKVLQSEKLAGITARINRTNLYGQGPKNRPTVRFLRSGKMWGVIIG